MQTSVATEPPVLAVQGLKVWFRDARGQPLRAVESLDLTVARGEILCVVGESGCGKSVAALSVMGLLARPGEIVAGSISLCGRELVGLPEAEMVRVRGEGVAMVFQQPKASLNPVKRVGNQIAEQFIRHRHLSRADAWKRSLELLERVGIPNVAEKARAYPHQLSGGQAQRVMIAMAIALEPTLLIADEPTTALDSTVQAQILELLRELCRESGTALVLVTHDLGVAAQMADRVAVMYAGRVVEVAPVADFFEAPAHPYSRGLLEALPRLGHLKERLADIPGSVPQQRTDPVGCSFSARCDSRDRAGRERCDGAVPPLITSGRGGVCCWLAAAPRAAA